MVLLLGANTFIGQAFARALRGRAEPFVPLSLESLDYTQFELLFDYIRKVKPALVINAEERLGTSTAVDHADGDHSSDADEAERFEMLRANALLPQTIGRACAMTHTPWGHVSSGGIFSGARLFEDGAWNVHQNLASLELLQLFAQHPERFRGFAESDPPNRSFRHPPCAFYHGTKALAEESLAGHTGAYVWRFQLPFNEQEHPGNFLWQLHQGTKFPHGLNSLSHVDDCVRACLEMADAHAPFGVYNVVNPGGVATHEVLRLLHQTMKSPRLELLVYPEQSFSTSEQNSHAGCLLGHARLDALGIKRRPALDAIQKSLTRMAEALNSRGTVNGMLG